MKHLLFFVTMLPVVAHASICDQLAEIAIHMSKSRQVGYSYERVVAAYAQGAAQAGASGEQQLAMDRAHRYIAARVYAVPLQQTTAAQDASDRDLANRIYSECIQAYN